MIYYILIKTFIGMGIMIVCYIMTTNQSVVFNESLGDEMSNKVVSPIFLLN